MKNRRGQDTMFREQARQAKQEAKRARRETRRRQKQQRMQSLQLPSWARPSMEEDE